MANDTTSGSSPFTTIMLIVITVATLGIAYRVCFVPVEPQCVQCEASGETDTVTVGSRDTVVLMFRDSVVPSPGDEATATFLGDRVLDDSVVVVGGDSPSTLIIRHGPVARRSP